MSHMFYTYVASVLSGYCLCVAIVFKSYFRCFCKFQTYVLSICSKCFICFQTYVASVLSGCCKSRSRCCIYMHVASICFKVFSRVLYVCLQVFYLDVAYVCNSFQIFFRCFSKCFKRLFQVFHLSSFVCCNCCI